jgi:hypothetical protein
MSNNDFTQRSASVSARILLNIYRNISNKSVETDETHTFYLQCTFSVNLIFIEIIE